MDEKPTAQEKQSLIEYESYAKVMFRFYLVAAFAPLMEMIGAGGPLDIPLQVAAACFVVVLPPALYLAGLTIHDGLYEAYVREHKKAVKPLDLICKSFLTMGYLWTFFYFTPNMPWYLSATAAFVVSSLVVTIIFYVYFVWPRRSARTATPTTSEQQAPPSVEPNQ